MGNYRSKCNSKQVNYTQDSHFLELPGVGCMYACMKKHVYSILAKIYKRKKERK